MRPDPRLRALLEQALDSDSTPEEVCRDAPELVDELRRELARLAPLRDELERWFPAHPPAVAPAAPPAPGLAVPGYALEQVLGRGGMGIVYRARHSRLGQVVALKMLLSGANAQPGESARFRREAEVIASLRHPNIVQVHDIGDVAGCAWFTMEFVDGGTLAQRMRRHVSAREAALLTATLARAVQCAHDSGIVHRDLKPSNVLLTEDGTPKISDFGLARRIDGDTALTLGAAVGTPSYMAPEQLSGPGGRVGPAADVHALGAILYELLAGQPPFRGATPAATLRQVLEEEPVPPSRRSSRVPVDLETIAMKCLRKDPVQRYASSADLAEDLQRFLRHEPVRARRIGPLARAQRWCRRRPAAALLVGFALAGLGWAAVDRALAEVEAAERRAAGAPWAAHLERVTDALSRADLPAASSLLDQVPDELPLDLRARSNAARSELNLARRLDSVRMGRAAIVDSRFDPARNRALADRSYAAAFEEAGFDVLRDDAALLARRIQRHAIARTLIAALDDWALCAAEPQRHSVVLALARACDPDPDGWRDRARDPALRGDSARLLELAEQAPLESASVQQLLALGEELERAGADARTYLRSVQRRHSADFWANFALGYLLWQREPEEAARYMQAAVAIRPDSALAHLGLGRAMVTLQRMPEALECFSAAVRIAPEYSHAHANLGNALIATQRPEEARDEFEIALRLDPGAARNHYNMGTLLADESRYEEALPFLFEAVRLEPEAPNNRAYLGISLRALGRDEEGLEHLRRSVEIDPLDSFSWHHLGVSLHRVKRYEEAIVAYTEAKRLRPASVAPSHYIATCLYALGRMRESLPHFEEALRLAPDTDLYRRNYGMALLRCGRFAEAAVELRAIHERSPSDSDTGLALARSELLRGESAVAVRTWREWIARSEDRRQALDGFAEVCLYAGDRNAYEAALDDLLEANAEVDDPRVHETTGRACLLAPPSPERFERGNALVDRALAADPATYPGWVPPYFQFAKALAEYRGGELDAAIARLHADAGSALRPAPQLVLAMALHDSGRGDDARAVLAQALMEFDWGRERAEDRESWMYHALRREAVSLVLPGLAAEGVGGYDDASRAALLAEHSAAARHAAAADLAARWLAEDPALHVRFPKARWKVACAALFAGLGRGSDATRTSAERRRALRETALRVFEDDVAELARGLDLDDASLRDAARRRLGNWLADRNLDPERGGLEIDALPPAEQPAWRGLLAEAAELLRRTSSAGN